MVNKGASASSTSELERRIYFYEIDAGHDDAGQRIPFDPVPTLRDIKKLSFPGCYMPDGDDKVLVCWVDKTTLPARVRFGRKRLGDFPLIEKLGDTSPLAIPSGAGLVEPIHVVFFPGMIVGAEFNFHGPRITRLAEYMRTMVSGCVPISFRPKLRPDVAIQLANLQDVTLFRMKIRAPYIEDLEREDPDFFRRVSGIVDLGSAEDIELILRPRRSSGHKLNRRLLELAKHLGQRTGLRDEVKKFRIKGYDQSTGKNEDVNVLDLQYLAKKRIVRQELGSRAVDSSSAYSAIEEAYHELRDELNQAPGAYL